MPVGQLAFDFPLSPTPCTGTRYARYAEFYRFPRSVVYFARRDGFIKIGTTQILRDRLRQISKGSGMIPGMTIGPVELLAVVPGDRYEEKRLHQRFAHLRVGGEWFLPDDELMGFITEAQALTPA